jgi:ATP-dependent DNA helicase 2 subunit 2
MIILDVSGTMSTDRFSLAKSVCSNLVQQKLIFAPRDEIGLLLAGSRSTLNRMNVSAPDRYQHFVVARPIGPPSLDLYQHIEGAKQEASSMDMMEALIVAADAIYERTGERRYQRRVFLVSDVQQTVKRKEELTTVLAFYKKQDIQLVVIGVDFEHPEDIVPGNEDWDSLTSKQQNERVLQFVCKDLSGDGGGSLIIPVSDALEALSALRKRAVAQRAVARCVLSIGDIRIAVHLHTKTLLARIPSLKKTAEKGLVVEKKYFSAANPDKELEAAVRVKAYRYGKSVIPFTEVDEAQLKFQAERSMMALGFVPMSQIPMHHLMGGIRAVAPAPGDAHGARALSALVQGMDQMQRAMLVRFVRCTNANPMLGVCMPSPKAERDILYFAPLPFAEDVRHYQFTTYSDVVVKPEEANAVDALVNAMTMDKDTLRPSETFNPALQYYYQCVKDRYLRNAAKAADGTPIDTAACSSAPLPPLDTALLRSSAKFQNPASTLSAMYRGAQTSLTVCHELFPYVDPEEAAGSAGSAGKTYWFATGGADSKAATASVKAEGIPSPYDALTPVGSSPGGGTAATPLSAQEAAKLSAGSHSGVLHVSTSDPIGTFAALTSGTSTHGSDLIDRALFEMTEVILKLARSSIGRSYYKKCNECVDALRVVCVKEEEAQCFNRFLINLMCAVKGTDHDPYWTQECVARGVRPITRLEVRDSDIADAAAAEAFVFASRAAEVPVVEANEEDDLFGMLE